MKRYDVDMRSFNQRKEELVKAQTWFNLEIQNYPELNSLDKELKLLRMVYEVFSQHTLQVVEYSSTLRPKLNIEALQKTADEFDKKVRRMPKDTKELGELVTFHKLEELIASFKNSVPLINSLKHDVVRAQRWLELVQLADMDESLATPENLQKLTLQVVFQMELFRFPDEVLEIVITAQNELKTENEVAKIESTWRNMSFQMQPYKGERGHVLLPNEEMKQVLDDNILTLQTMGSSKYAAKLMDTIKRWERNLNTVGEVVDAWLLVQRKWQYLESIFLDSDDIWLQLPEEAKKFDRIHKTFHQTMITTQQNPNVLDSCCQEGRLAEFNGLTSEFDRIQKSLTDYLDMKRSAFPRFYLISDDELLSILGTSEPKAVQPHMLKLFANCREVEFSRGGQIVGMYSEEGEHFNFHNPVRVEGSVEDRMNTVDEAIQDTLQRMSKSAVYLYGSQDRIPWVHQYIDMVAILGTQIWWTW